MKYPKECPVFEVVTPKRGANFIKAGAIVEGVPCEWDFGTDKITVRAVDDADYIGPQRDECMQELGWVGAWVSANGLRPLTRAARNMLALVTGEVPDDAAL